jgi:anti-anti-sigma factor
VHLRPDIEVTSESVECALIVHLAGELDLFSAEVCGARLRQVAVARRPPFVVVVDLSEVRFLAVAGIRALLEFATCAAGRGIRTHFVAPVRLTRIMTRVGVAAQLPCFASRDEALSGFLAQAADDAGPRQVIPVEVGEIT